MARMVSGLTPCFSAMTACATHSYCAFQCCAVHRIANSDSRGGTLVLKRRRPPSFCASSPKTGECRKTANGPDSLNWPRGPDFIDSASARCSAVKVSSESSGRRGDCMFLCIFLGMVSSSSGRAGPHYCCNVRGGLTTDIASTGRVDWQEHGEAGLTNDGCLPRYFVAVRQPCVLASSAYLR